VPGLREYPRRHSRLRPARPRHVYGPPATVVTTSTGHKTAQGKAELSIRFEARATGHRVRVVEETGTVVRVIRYQLPMEDGRRLGTVLDEHGNIRDLGAGDTPADSALEWIISGACYLTRVSSQAGSACPPSGTSGVRQDSGPPFTWRAASRMARIVTTKVARKLGPVGMADYALEASSRVERISFSGKRRRSILHPRYHGGMLVETKPTPAWADTQSRTVDLISPART
jgi:hypothetical protein